MVFNTRLLLRILWGRQAYGVVYWLFEFSFYKRPTPTGSAKYEL